MPKMFYGSIFSAFYIIAFINGQQLQPGVYIGGASKTPVTNGSTYSTTAPYNSSINVLNITCGVDTETNGVSHVNLTCPLDTDRSLEFSSLGSSGSFLLELRGTGLVFCQCSMTNISGTVVGTTSFKLNVTVVPYVPKVAPIIKYGNLTLSDGETVDIELGLLDNKTIKISWGVYDGYPLVSNITLTCDDEILTFDKDNRVSYSIAITKAWDGTRCVCNAGHVTGLYNLTSSFIFNVTYVPTRDPVLLIGDTKQYNGSTYFFQSNYSVMALYCEVPDGNPKVTNITFTFYFESGPQVIATDGYYGNFLASLGGIGSVHYVCTGGHVTGLYRKQTIVYVIYNVSPNVPTMTPDVIYKTQYIQDGGEMTAVVTVRSPTLFVVCRVFDGYPKASNVTLQCGSYNQVINNYTGVFAISDARKLHSTRCICSGQHVTGLYNKTSSFTLYVIYHSNVTKLTANGAMGSLTVQPGTSVTIACEADGYPPPQMSLYGLRTGNSTFGGPVMVSGTTLSRTFIASIATSDIYVCVAENHVDRFNVGDRLVEVSVGDTEPSTLQRFTVNGEITQLTANVGDFIQFKCDTTGSSRRTILRGMTSEMLLHDQIDSLGSGQINAWRTVTCDFYDTFECRVVILNNVTAAEVSKTFNLTVNNCTRVVTALTSTSSRATYVTTSATSAPLTVTWNEATVSDGTKLKVPIKYSSLGKEELNEFFLCSGSSQVQTIEFSCTIPGNGLPKSVRVDGSSASFTFTTRVVHEWSKCKCTAYYSIFSTGRTQAISFQLSSQADLKKGLIGMSITLLSSVLTTALVTQVLGHKLLC